MFPYDTHHNVVLPSEDELEMTSPQSTERLLSDYLRSDYQQARHFQPHHPLSSQQYEEAEAQLVFLRDAQQYNSMTIAPFSNSRLNKNCSKSALWDGTFLSLEEEIIADSEAVAEQPTLQSSNNLLLELNTFSDLQAVITSLKEFEKPAVSTAGDSLNSTLQKVNNGHSWLTTEEDLIHLSSSELNKNVPPAIRHNLESSQLMDVLMLRAVQHWCCIGFKVAPISVDLIKDWRKAPKSIVYCIASISLVTLMDRDHKQHHKGQQQQQQQQLLQQPQQLMNAGSSSTTADADNMYSRQAAMAFYEQARNNLNDIVFDDMQPFIIQSYFCLSYTSNLLRLYEQQRTWGSLASIALQHVTSTKMSAATPIDDLTLGCWFRWYYVDAWMCLTLNRDCLLPDRIPWITSEEIERLSLLSTEQQNIYGFANLTIYMRRYIRALHSGKLFANHQQKSQPSAYYYQITSELTHWYSQLKPWHSISDLHLHLCYNSMRVVILYQFLDSSTPPPDDILIDCLQTNLELLQALQHLKELGCDQSTYHHMFFAIHNTAKRIYQYNHSPSIEQLKPYAKEQLQINLMLLKSTPAYAHDVFKIKLYAQKIQDQFSRLNIYLPPAINTAAAPTVSEIKDTHLRYCFKFKQDKRFKLNNGAADVSSSNPFLLPLPATSPPSRLIPFPFLPQATSASQHSGRSSMGPLLVVFRHENQRAKGLKKSTSKKTATPLKTHNKGK